MKQLLEISRVHNLKISRLSTGLLCTLEISRSCTIVEVDV